MWIKQNQWDLLSQMEKNPHKIKYLQHIDVYLLDYNYKTLILFAQYNTKRKTTYSHRKIGKYVRLQQRLPPSNCNKKQYTH